MLHALLAGSLLGFVSLPHCAAMCGPLSAFACSRSAARAAPLRYQAGRLLGYGFAGALAGQLGTVLSLAAPSAPTVLVFAGLAALSCLLLAYSLVRPSRTADVLVQLGSAPRKRPWLDALARILPRDPSALGTLSVLLPCGVLGAALLSAVAAGSALFGTLLMVGFALSSGVALLSAAALSRLLSAHASRLTRSVVAALLVVSAVLIVARPVTALLASDTTHDAPRCH